MTEKFSACGERFCGCCGDCLRCYGDGANCWWCTYDPDDPGGCPDCVDDRRTTGRGASEPKGEGRG